MSKQPILRAQDIVDMLSLKHTNDIFVPECKDGPTWSGSHLRLDAWAMKKSYSSPLLTGYEVKISRSDFVNDSKLHEYLNLCNALYIVCPAGLIDKSEVPDGCGLMCTSKTGSRIYIKKKAPYRQIEEPASLYKYILMSRARVVGPYQESAFDKKGYMERYVDRKIESERVGIHLGRRLRERIESEIEEVKKENNKLLEQNSNLQDIKDIIGEMGLEVTDWNLGHKFERQAREAKKLLPADFDFQVRNLASQLKDIVKVMDKFKEVPDGL